MLENTADIRRSNLVDVIRAIHGSARTTRKAIATEKDLSFATVANIVTSLIRAGLVRESGLRRQGTGRPTAELALNPELGFLLGVDIAETYVHVETFDAALLTIGSTTVALDPQQNGAASVATKIKQVIAQEVNRTGIPAERILGVGVSAPGLVDPIGGASVFAPNWAWHNVPLLELLKDAVDAPLTLDNPLKALVVAEQWSGFGRGVDDFAVLSIGTGVGAGLSIGGRLHRGRTNSAGEWGHSVLVADGRGCRCGSNGCVEAYIGAPGILETLRELDPTSPLLRGDDQTASMTALAVAIAAGDPTAQEVLARTGHFLGITIANIVNILNPELVIISGWVVDTLGQALLEAARPAAKRHALAVPMGATRIERQEIGRNGVSLGAGTLALEHYLDSLSDVPPSGRTSTKTHPELADRR